ncbi:MULTISPECIES: hypothetical protein [Bradyrhizobium]|uniref:Uncharacterized protein n=1 Tax=Bradyrhizobium aeschynomenes TaxID=2734909 RepID=A0ABX2CC22_9BRAD|nr:MULTISPECIES: hypothetical protein [Bradyrhizobium]MCA1527359.1 hypothetical protein [Bradyrhizobium yuanmingense]NPU12064.1 hypothetical protein [Bradyrhizobium aeschynomenes]NPU65368.1 hypothetical protein [Bradyrhizobium aeschynomenes]
MSNYYFSAKVDDDTTLCIAPITARRIELSGQEIADDSGYFLFQTKGGAEPSEVEILARLTSEEAVLRLSQMLDLK